MFFSTVLLALCHKATLTLVQWMGKCCCCVPLNYMPFGASLFPDNLKSSVSRTPPTRARHAHLRARRNPPAEALCRSRTAVRMNEMYVTVFVHRLRCFISTQAMIRLISLMRGYLFCSADKQIFLL